MQELLPGGADDGFVVDDKDTRIPVVSFEGAPLPRRELLYVRSPRRLDEGEGTDDEEVEGGGVDAESRVDLQAGARLSKAGFVKEGERAAAAQGAVNGRLLVGVEGNHAASIALGGRVSTKNLLTTPK